MSRIEINQNSFSSEFDTQSDDILLHPTRPTEFSCRAIFLGLILCLIPITTIVVGSMYSHGVRYCPIEKDLPLFLIIGGVLSLSCCFLIMITPIIQPLKFLGSLSDFLQLLNAAWFIVICVYVYRISSQVQFEDMNKDTYCEEILYEFAFWTTTSILVLIAAAILLALIIYLGCKCFVYNRDVENTEDDNLYP